MKECIHPTVSCINPYEYIRKYRCNSCGEVMMCTCEEEFARRFLPHQLSHGTELDTKIEVQVTLGFQKSICNSCRGIPEEAHPKAQIYGMGSKIVRYYWREIAFETIQRFGDWAERQGHTDWLAAQLEHRDKYKFIECEVIKEIRELHECNPKYDYQEDSQSEVLTNYGIQIINIDGIYVKTPERSKKILDGKEVCSAEDFVARYFERLGYEVLFTESVPFHTIFGIFMWLLIQDPSDSRGRIVGFGDRIAFEEGREGKQIWTSLPEDFGSSGYFERRKAAIEAHFALLPQEKDELLWTFDYWIDPSYELRQYLWAHCPQDVEKAREIVEILPVNVIRRILKYLIGNYWVRYLGWPDLLVHNQAEFFFAEVKSSRDKLSEDQKNWIRDNNNELHLQFKLVKVHKKGLINGMADSAEGTAG